VYQKINLNITRRKRRWREKMKQRRRRKSHDRAEQCEWNAAAPSHNEIEKWRYMNARRRTAS